MQKAGADSDTGNKGIKAMADILKAWNAGFVRRWHTHPNLVESDDRNSGHQQRCAILLILLWPDSTRDAIIDALIHDQGEIDAGDMAHPAKVKHPQIRGLIHDVEIESITRQGFVIPSISEEEMQRHAFVDLLDSYLWMVKAQPNVRHRSEWKAQAQRLYVGAETLDISETYSAFMSEFLEFYT